MNYTSENIEIKIDNDKMRARIIYRGPLDPTLHEENIFLLLKEKNIKFGIKRNKIDEVLEKIKNKKEENIVKIDE